MYCIPFAHFNLSQSLPAAVVPLNTIQSTRISGWRNHRFDVRRGVRRAGGLTLNHRPATGALSSPASPGEKRRIVFTVHGPFEAFGREDWAP